VTISRISVAIGAQLVAVACTVSPTEPSGSDVNALAGSSQTPTQRPAAPPSPRPSPTQLEAEVDPVLPPVEDATPER